jgi:hypothetical protein
MIFEEKATGEIAKKNPTQEQRDGSFPHEIMLDKSF